MRCPLMRKVVRMALRCPSFEVSLISMLVTQHFALWMLGLASAETQSSEHERRCLAHHARGKKKLVEIGVWHGVSTCVLRCAMDPDGELLCVDPYPAGRFGFSVQQVIAQRTVS